MGDIGIDNHLRSDPAADIIHDIILGARRLKILCQTLELSLFDEIDTFKGPVSAAAIANRCGFNHDVTERLLNNLVCLKLLEKSKSSEGVYTYKNAVATAKYLIRSKKPSLVGCCISEVMMVLPALDNLAAVLKSDSSDTIALQMMKGEQNSNNTKSDDNGNNSSMKTKKAPCSLNTNVDRQMMFMSAMDGIAAPCTPAIARAYDLSANKTAVDLGGGSGCLAYEMSRTYPNMHLTVFDLPHVAKMAKKLQPEVTKDNVDIVAGDFFQDELPPADLYIISHVIHDWEVGKTDVLLSKAYQSLPPGGSLLLLEKTLNENKDGPPTSMMMDLVMAVISKGRERTPSEYRKLLKRHGFANTQIKKIGGLNYYDAILAKKPF